MRKTAATSILLLAEDEEEEGEAATGGGGRRAAEQGEVVGGGQENRGLPLLPLRQSRAPGSHLPVRGLRRAANHPDGQLPAGRGAWIAGSGWLGRRYLRFPPPRPTCRRCVMAVVSAVSSGGPGSTNIWL